MASIHKQMIEISGPDAHMYDGGPTGASDLQFRAFDEANESALNNIDWSQVEDALNDQLPDGFQAKVVDY